MACVKRDLMLHYLLMTLMLISWTSKPGECRRRRSGHIAKPFINDPECPLKPDLASKRKCSKKCHEDDDCKGRNKKCRCDGVCGWSCVKTNKKCEDLKNIPHGHYQLLTNSIFGHKVRYWCDEGWVLHGEEYRMCQGDGYWSGFTPTCHMYFPAKKCEDPEPLERGTFNITPHNSLGATLRYECQDGFMLMGQPERVCRADGHWSGMKPTCETDDRCRDPPEVDFASHSGTPGRTVFPLGAQLSYECHSGYKADGFAKAMCVMNGNWIGPRMTCQPQMCGHPGDIPYATREGTSFSYPNKVVYKCFKGYEMVGRDFRVCQRTGEWSGVLPKCLPVKCAKLSRPTNGHIIGNGYTYGANVSFTCTPGFKLVGSQYRWCLHDGSWSGEKATCPVVDCGHPGPFPNGKIEFNSGAAHTTHGAIIVFKCFESTRFQGESKHSSCMANGNWSYPLPTCWSKCRVDEIANGTMNSTSAHSEWIQHGQEPNYQCNRGFRKPPGLNSTCHNGTFINTPTCEPEPCKRRPDDVHDGIVRFFTSNHGDEAHYRCNTGFQMNGGTIEVAVVRCMYGNWTGVTPICEPKYCDYPGTIANGQILLVGVIGKYEYRPYVRKIGHNDHIEYHCNKTYKRRGPVGATCVAGKWSPVNKPICVPGQHPKLQYLYRGKRSAQYVGRTSVTQYNNGICEIPQISHGRILFRQPGQYVEHQQLLIAQCNHGYQLQPKNKLSTCNNGTLTVLHTCVKSA